MSKKLKVAVLMGGTSAERKVSLSTGRQIVSALDPSRYTVFALDTASGEVVLPPPTAGATGDPGAALVDIRQVASLAGVSLMAHEAGGELTSLADLNHVVKADRPDVVFIALHGPGGEDGTVQGMLELLGLRYTGSGVLASALAMDKVMSKRLLTSVGIRMPADTIVRKDDVVDSREVDLPAMVKPSRQGSTFGASIVHEPVQLGPALDLAFRYDDTALIEQYIDGTEITVPIIGNRNLEVLPIVEIVPNGGFYDYEAKYTVGATEEIVPARISSAVNDEARDIALTCHKTLGCRGMSRTDMIVTPDEVVYTLEVNTIPGMTPTSLLPRAAEAAGIPFSRLLDYLIEMALED